MEAIYERPRDYDLEHEGDEEDVAFYLKLLDRWRPRRVMELASGSGRVAIPLARAAAALQIEIVGLEREGPMLEEARRKAAALDDGERAGLSFLAADMRDWRTADPFDLVVAPCSSLSHLLTVDEQLAAWRCVYDNLTADGRFITDLTMPNLTAYADSMQMPPRAFVEIDLDARDPITGTRLLRYKTTRYLRTSSAPRSGFSTTDSRTATAPTATSATSLATSIIRARSSCSSASRASGWRRGSATTRCALCVRPVAS